MINKGSKVRFKNRVQQTTYPMTVTKVDGDKCQLDSGGWYTKNSLINDEEWKTNVRQTTTTLTRA